MLLLYIIVALYGLCYGSFLNVLYYRLPIHENIVSGRSHCPDCGTEIHWYENIPVFSYVFLRGRCSHCGLHISWRYPAIEIGVAAFAVAMFVVLPSPVAAGAAAIIAPLLILLLFLRIRFPH